MNPVDPGVPENLVNPHIVLTKSMLKYLKQTSPWLRFIGTLGYIFCSISVVGGIIFLVAISADYGLADELGDFPAEIAGLFYILLGILLFFPSRFLHKFGEKIRRFLDSNSGEDLEQAFKHNKSLWKYIGIICIIIIIVAPFLFFFTAIGILVN